MLIVADGEVFHPYARTRGGKMYVSIIVHMMMILLISTYSKRIARCGEYVFRCNALRARPQTKNMHTYACIHPRYWSAYS